MKRPITRQNGPSQPASSCKGASHSWGPETLLLKPSRSLSHFNRAALLLLLLHVHIVRVLWPQKTFPTWLWDKGPTHPSRLHFPGRIHFPSHSKCATSSTFNISMVYPTCTAPKAWRRQVLTQCRCHICHTWATSGHFQQMQPLW